MDGADELREKLVGAIMELTDEEQEIALKWLETEKPKWRGTDNAGRNIPGQAGGEVNHDERTD